MKTEAVVLRTHGGPEVLVPERIDLPDPGPREVRVRVRAVALNHLDLWVRRGMPNLKLEYPHRLGSDIVGEVDALGPGARTPLKPGDKVVVSPGVSCGVCERCLSGQDNLCRQYAILGEHTNGGYSRHVIVPDANLLPYPGDLPFTDVAAVPLVFLTAWQMVVDKARVRPGQTVLVQAAGSGVSSAAIQIAKLFGARVLTTTSTDAKAERARALGADAVINYATEDFVAEVKKLTGKRGVDVVIDHVGGEVMSKSVVAAAAGGRIVTCGATAVHSRHRPPPRLLPASRDPRLHDGIQGFALRDPRARRGRSPAPGRRPRAAAVGCGRGPPRARVAASVRKGGSRGGLSVRPS